MKVSVIIPVYNVQDYLARCIDSVVTQTHHDLEILLVDDGSTDASGDICNKLARQDQRITVIHKENGGLSDARNAGLDAMTGDYVTFIDGDDYVHPRFVELLLRTINSTSSDIAVCHWQELDEGQHPKAVNINTPPLASDCKLFTRAEALKSIFYQQELTHSACSRLFDARIFSDIRFPQGMLYEDLAIIYPIMNKVERVALIEPAMYYYMHRSGSITSTVSLKRTHVLKILDDLENQVSQQEPSLLPAVRSRHLSACFNMLRIMPLNDPAWQPTKKLCIDYTKKMRKLCLLDKEVRIKNKIAIILSYLGTPLLLLIVNRRKKK